MSTMYAQPHGRVLVTYNQPSDFTIFITLYTNLQ